MITTAELSNEVSIPAKSWRCLCLYPAVIKYIDQCFSNLLKAADKKKIKHLCMPFLAEGKGFEMIRN
jgi:hypothetical protein